MPLYKGTLYQRNIYLKDSEGVAVDVSGWTFEMPIRAAPGETPLVTLTTGNGLIETVFAGGGLIRFSVLADEAEEWEDGIVHFSMLRTDPDPGPIYLFGGKFRVETM